MRITNNMILNNSASNINDVKNSLDKTNTQMTNQQKINRPSEDPVIAVRSLRLQTTYAKTEQYYRKNIPDAASWLDVTETALMGIKDIITDMRTLSVNGATGTLTQDDRNTILTQLKQLQENIYSTANADYAGRTVFTGYRTDKTMTFMGTEPDTEYAIKQNISYEDVIQTKFLSNEVPLPTKPGTGGGGVVGVLDLTDDLRTDDYKTTETEYYRMRMAYNDITNINGGDIKIKAEDGTDIPINGNVNIYESMEEWEQASGIKQVKDDDIVVIKGTGDIILGNNVAYEIQSQRATLTVDYDKKGFLKGELRPEYYFNCTNKTDPKNPIDYVKEDRDYDINYTISDNQILKVNVEGADVFDQKPYQDMSDMINAVSYSINAHEKLEKVKKMIDDPNYADAENQEKLSQWKELLQKEADYADDHLGKLYTGMISNCDSYLADLNITITRLGCTVDQLKMTESRMSDYEQAVLELQSQNDNVDLSQVIIDYTAVYTAYQSSLTAAGRLYQQTLLNYI